MDELFELAELFIRESIGEAIHHVGTSEDSDDDTRRDETADIRTYGNADEQFAATVSEYLDDRGLTQYTVQQVTDDTSAQEVSIPDDSADVLITPENEDGKEYAAAVDVDETTMWVPLGPITYRCGSDEKAFPYDPSAAEDDADTVDYAASDDQIHLYGALVEFAQEWPGVEATISALDASENQPDEAVAVVRFTDPAVSGPDTAQYMEEHLQRYYDRYVEQHR